MEKTKLTRLDITTQLLAAIFSDKDLYRDHILEMARSRKHCEAQLNSLLSLGQCLIVLDAEMDEEKKP